MLPARTFSVSIAMDWQALYERIWQPAFFPTWAAGLSDVDLRPDGDSWLATGPEGAVRIHFTPHNIFGVMDHCVDTGAGELVYVPLRVVANGEGAEVVLTLYRQPDMTDERFAADIKLVNRDMKALKQLVEGQG
ncbi:MAG TPA: polyketide cyclase [Sphingobium sp.]|nr:polyketide cyclase [Sphingobium sp.]